ncbi:hypothetical protein ANN_18690 [Periplaneta americana]|uniref:HAT C-terminal dimerisation domain-containing protein n=1 Tax=Periplaneta americana TaxID=6978 RepID=A0ABQ8SPF4_PERAM|nr:hypothetical protein ANN_18690 [Periplaneta americana]
MVKGNGITPRKTLLVRFVHHKFLLAQTQIEPGSPSERQRGTPPRFLMDYSFEDSFSEVGKALRITLTAPVSTAESERSFSTLNKIKTFLRNTMGQDRLNSLAFCPILKEHLHQIPNLRKGHEKIEKLLSSSLLSKNLKVRIHKTIIISAVLYGCETWTLTLREEQRLRVFENKMLRKIFGAKRDEVTGECRKLYNVELHALYSSPYIIRNIKSRRLIWAEHVARMGESRNAYRLLVGRPEEKGLWGDPGNDTKTLQVTTSVEKQLHFFGKTLSIEFALSNTTMNHVRNEYAGDMEVNEYYAYEYSDTTNNSGNTISNDFQQLSGHQFQCL